MITTSITTSTSIRTPNPDESAVVDSSGFPIFSHGTGGYAHVRVHRMLDEGRMRQGREFLRRWLLRHPGHGPEWVHLHWHMMVFDLAAGAWWDAYGRFLAHVLPASGDGEE